MADDEVRRECEEALSGVMSEARQPFRQAVDGDLMAVGVNSLREPGYSLDVHEGEDDVGSAGGGRHDSDGSLTEDELGAIGSALTIESLPTSGGLLKPCAG